MTRLHDLCTTAEYEAATPEQQMDFDLRWLARWERNAQQQGVQRDFDEERQHGWALGEPRIEL